jgi:hypothetical protein
MPAPKALPDQESEPEPEPEPEEDLPELSLVFLPREVETPPPLTPVHSTDKPKQKRSALWPTGHDEKGQMLLFA